VTDLETLFEQLRDRLPPQHDWTDLLKDPDRVAQIRVSLTQKLNDTNSQLSERKESHEAFRLECQRMGDAGARAWNSAQTEYADWRKRTIRFQRMVQARVAQVKAVEKRLNVNRTESDYRQSSIEHRNALRKLALGVYDHQTDTMDDKSLEPSSADQQLWALLDKIKIPNGNGKISLLSAVEDLWYDE
jgi:hypothetical protein